MIKGGYHLFEAGAYDRAYDLLGSASDWLRNRGRVREGLRILEPFLPQAVQQTMQRVLVGRLLGTVGLAYHRLGQPQRAIDFYQQQLTITREIGDCGGEANACWNLGLQLVTLERLAEALPLMEVCVRFEQEIGHPDADKDAALVGELRQRLAGQATE